MKAAALCTLTSQQHIHSDQRDLLCLPELWWVSTFQSHLCISLNYQLPLRNTDVLLSSLRVLSKELGLRPNRSNSLIYQHSDNKLATTHFKGPGLADIVQITGPTHCIIPASCSLLCHPTVGIGVVCLNHGGGSSNCPPCNCKVEHNAKDKADYQKVTQTSVPWEGGAECGQSLPP